MRSQRGFALIEVIVASALFMVLSGLIFSFFSYGARSFQHVNSKHGLQMDALRVIESLQTELKRSALGSVTLRNDSTRAALVDGETVSRDVVNFATLQSWQDRTNSINFDLQTGVPKWNRYLTFYATTEPEGQLIRHRVDPNPPPETPLPISRDDFASLYYDDPSVNLFDGARPQYIALCKNVHEFSIERPLGESSFLVHLKLKERHTSSPQYGGQRRAYDYYELALTIRPENSFPNDL